VKEHADPLLRGVTACHPTRIIQIPLGHSSLRSKAAGANNRLEANRPPSGKPNAAAVD
jgi:hypothetical protein